MEFKKWQPLEQFAKFNRDLIKIVFHHFNSLASLSLITTVIYHLQELASGVSLMK